MKLNGISKIKSDAGDFIVLSDYGLEGIAISHQAATVEAAVEWMLTCDYGAPQTVVQLVEIYVAKPEGVAP